MAEKKKQKWHKKRHTFYFHVGRGLVRGFVKHTYRYKGEVVDNKKQNYLFLLNHQTPLDQNLLYLSVKRHPYTIASEDLFAMGNTTKLIRHIGAPIPFKKSMSDVKAVMTCLRVAREGNSILLFPEGNRTFTGETCNIKPAVAKLVKAIGLPVVIYKLSGGYGVFPRYADKARKKVKMTGSVQRILTKEEYKSLSDEELYELLKKELYHDESESKEPCKGKHRAEYLERAVYLCPRCKSVGKIYSKGNKVFCSSCGLEGELSEHLRFNEGFPVSNVKEWTALQLDWVNSYKDDAKEPVTVEEGRLLRLNFEKAKKDVIYKRTTVKLFSDRIEAGEKVFPFSELDAATVCGKRILGFYAGGETYQIDGANNFCALKYVNLFYHYQHGRGKEHGFFGI